MSRRSAHLSRLALALCLISSGFAQRPGPAGRGMRQPQFQTPSSLLVRVVFSNGQTAGSSLWVQLMSSGGTPAATSPTDSNGEASFPSVQPGTYRIQITGPGIEPTASEAFVIQPGEPVHNETVQVKLRSGTQQGPGSPQATVSTTTLNVPDKARKEFEKGNGAVQQHDLEKARKHYEKAVEQYPKFAAAYSNAGFVCIAMRDFGCARDSFQKAISADEHFARPYVGLSRVHMIEHNYPEAETLLQKSLSMDPLSAEALALLANTELIEGKYDAAIANARKVHTVEHRQYAIAHFIAAKALEAKSKPQDAAAEYKLFVEEAPNDPNAADARAAVARLAAK